MRRSRIFIAGIGLAAAPTGTGVTGRLTVARGADGGQVRGTPPGVPNSSKAAGDHPPRASPLTCALYGVELALAKLSRPRARPAR
jgi:hypothetical protein